MVLLSRYNQAAALLAGLDACRRRKLEAACRRIQKVQQEILRQGAVYLEHCGRVCKGLCCRNLNVAEIVSFYDFVLVLVSCPSLADLIAQRARAARKSHSADCVFLKDGRGPCLFPPDLKPERCVTSFCFHTGKIRRELSWLRRSFTRLVWLIWWYRLPGIFRGRRVEG